MKLQTIGAAGLLLSVASVAISVQAGGEKKRNWIDQAECRAFSQFEAPQTVLKSTVQIIGVDIGSKGEFIRMDPVAGLLNKLPDTLKLD